MHLDSSRALDKLCTLAASSLSPYSGNDQQVDGTGVENCGRECMFWNKVGTCLASVKSGENSRCQVYVVQDSLVTNLLNTEQQKQKIKV